MHPVGPLVDQSLTDLRHLLQLHEAGEKLAVEVRRGDKPVTLTVELGPLPAAAGP